MSETNVTVPGRGRRGFFHARTQGRIREANGEATRTVPRLRGQHWAPATGKYDDAFLFFELHVRIRTKMLFA